MELNLDDNPYQILELQEPFLEISEADIKKAFRKLALLKHPDKNRKNPNAANEFNKIQKAYEVLTDAEAKKAFDDVLRAKLQREARWADQDARRRKMREDLEQKEKISTAERSAEDLSRTRWKHELDRLRQQHAAQAAPAAPAPKRPAPGPEYSYVEDEAPSTAPQSDAALQEQLARTLKVQWDVSISDYTASDLRSSFETFGPIADVIIRDSGASAAAKKRRKGSALVVMADVGAASAAANAVSGDMRNPLLVMRMAGGPPGPARRDPTPGEAAARASGAAAPASVLPPKGPSVFPAAAALPRGGAPARPLFPVAAAAGGDARAAGSTGGFSSFPAGFSFGGVAGAVPRAPSFPSMAAGAEPTFAAFAAGGTAATRTTGAAQARTAGDQAQFESDSGSDD